MDQRSFLQTPNGICPFLFYQLFFFFLIKIIKFWKKGKQKKKVSSQQPNWEHRSREETRKVRWIGISAMAIRVSSSSSLSCPCLLLLLFFVLCAVFLVGVSADDVSPDEDIDPKSPACNNKFQLVRKCIGCFSFYCYWIGVEILDFEVLDFGFIFFILCFCWIGDAL